jgi:hypothetical protein
MERNNARNGLAERELRVQGVISRSPMMRTEINQARGCRKPTERTQVEHNLNPDIQFRGWSVAGKQPKKSGNEIKETRNSIVFSASLGLHSTG